MPVDPHRSAADAFGRRYFQEVRHPLSVALISAAAAFAALASSVSAQQYKSEPVDEKAKANRPVAQTCAGGTKDYTTEKERVAEFFNKYYFPSMTRYQPADLEMLGKNRYVLVDTFLWKNTNPEYQRDLTDWAYTAMRAVAAGGYHPAVRYNAVLILGLLDEEYAIEQGANRRPPKPLAKANTTLVQIVNAGAAGNAVPPALLAGALIGLERHAKYRDGLPRDAVEPMTAAVLKIVNQDKPKIDVDRDVYAWIRLKAAGVLAQLGVVGTNNQIHDGLMKLIGDGRSLDDRCETAALLAKIKYDGAKIDGKAATEKMLALAGDVADAEAKRAEEYRDRSIAGGGGIMAGRESYRGRGEEGGIGGSYTSEEPVDEYPRRHVLTRLAALRTGLKALSPAVPADSQKKFDAIVAALNPVIDAAANKDTVSLNVANAVVTMANTIKAIAGTAAPAASVMEEAGFDAPAKAPAEATPKAAGKAPAEAAAAPTANGK